MLNLGPRAVLLAILELPEPIMITSHVHADLDGTAAGYALLRLLKDLFRKDAFLHLFEPSAEAKWAPSEDREYNSAIVLDTHKPSRCPIREVPVVVIDHHKPEKTRKNAIGRIDSKYSSTSEMVTLVFKSRDIMPSKEIAERLLRGIISDTKGFVYASKYAFEAAAYLRETLDEIAKLFEHEEPLSARIASLKAMQRMSLHRVRNRILAISHVSAYESKAASDILRAGADVAVVYSKNRVVVRSREPLLDLAKTLSVRDVGGHDKAFVIVTDAPKVTAEKFKELVLSLWRKSDETKKQ